MSREVGNRLHSGSSATYGRKLELTRGSYQAFRAKFSTEQAQPQARTKACGKHSRRKLHPNSKLHPNMLQYSTIAAYSRPLLCQNCLFTDSVEEVVTFRCFFNKRVFFSCFCHWQAQGLRRNTLFLPIEVSPGIRLAWTWLAVFRAADGLRVESPVCMMVE